MAHACEGDKRRSKAEGAHGDHDGLGSHAHASLAIRLDLQRRKGSAAAQAANDLLCVNIEGNESELVAHRYMRGTDSNHRQGAEPSPSGFWPAEASQRCRMLTCPHAMACQGRLMPRLNTAAHQDR